MYRLFDEEIILQAKADGIILACSSIISFDISLSTRSVIGVLCSAGITLEEWNRCEDTFSKEIILERLNGKLEWLEL